MWREQERDDRAVELWARGGELCQRVDQTHQMATANFVNW